ncbi:MAG: glycosyltransferase family 4 protein [Polyangiales bacterium]
MAEVLFVSKPVTPPWNDSSKNLARDVAGHLQRHSPILLNQSRVETFRRLVFGERPDLWHFFFAPNLKSSQAGRLAKAIRRVPCVQTVCSLPPEHVSTRSLLFADVTVALSRAAYERFRRGGTSESALRVIPPCVPALRAPNAKERAALRQKHGLDRDLPVWIYPGDLEFGDGAELALHALAASNRPDTVLLMACRRKTAAADAALSRCRSRAEQWGIEARIRWLGETPDIHELLALSDFVLMVNGTPYAKMDYPLVALEAMSLGRPVLVAEATPAAELADEGAALAVEPDPEALAEAIERLSSDEAARRALTARARTFVTTKLSPERVAAAYESLYSELCG